MAFLRPSPGDIYLYKFKPKRTLQHLSICYLVIHKKTFFICSESAILYKKLETHIYSMQIPNEIQLNIEGTTAMTEK